MHQANTFENKVIISPHFFQKVYFYICLIIPIILVEFGAVWSLCCLQS